MSNNNNMGVRNGILRAVLALGLALAFSIPSHGQGTIQPLHLTFDGPPPQLPGTGKIVQEYYEAGMSFTPIDPNSPLSGFVRQGGSVSFYPENGTAYLQAGLGSTLMFSFISDAVFDLVSVQLAEYSTVVPDAVTVYFVGYRHDGSIVTTNMTTDGIIDGTGPVADFETFYFDDRFTGLDRVEIPTYGWSLDNLFVTPVPEPATSAVLLTGGFFLSVLRHKRSASH